MKFKPCAKSGGVLVELSSKDTQLPADSTMEKTLAAFHLKKILVPVDFSNCSKKALLYAIPFAKQFDAAITVLNVAPYSVQPPGIVVDDAELLDASRAAMENVVHEIGPSVPVETIVRMGNAASEIVRVAAESQVDLIIISTHGTTGLMHVFLGSTAERVVRHAPCPVLVVREKEHEFVNPESFNPVI